MVMLNKFRQVQEEWGGSSEVIDHWLETRQALLVQYVKLAALQPASASSNVVTLPSKEELHEFSQHLVDYISEGHFKIYDMVMDKWSSTGFQSTEEISQTYAKIVLTTEPLLSFTDKYAEISDDDLHDFESDMSKVGEVLELRFEVEDLLIKLIADSLAIPPGA
ncbi:Rsd/AlgQ family anti-sigma factor [Vibrio ezurae]|uniref:Sigma-D factor regulatory protein n=1 Tax=Vibrio ezurae NBRC 102218 TaxID=1219080 RepID=U3B6C2_9VIBR|nr:Rsd/AlgQ family anti-sigma factor [Vibrio ezurae]GAD80972.1 sigma-D factor regulatory protein [Vibrio ezurae NBRC 102218]